MLYSASRKNWKTMLITVDIRTSRAAAANAVSDLPCWHSFEEKLQDGDVLALAGRYAG